jgi:two-component system cell cycle sensor histidine kinase/response regulator CckA
MRMNANGSPEQEPDSRDHVSDDHRNPALNGLAQAADVERELRLRLCQQAAISELSQQVLSGTDLDTLMSDAVQLLADNLDVEYAKILERLPEGEGLLLKHGVGWKPGLVGQAIVPAGAESQAGYTLLSNQPVIVTDLRHETRFSGPELLTHHGVVSGMSVIIQGPEDPYGILAAHTTKEREFSESDVNFLQSIANILAEAIARHNLLQNLQMQSIIIEQIHDAVVTTDLDGFVTSWNHGAELLFGYSRKEAVGRHISFVYEEDQQDFLQHRIIEPLLKQGQNELEVRMHRKSGRPFYAHLSLSLLRNADDQIIGMIGYSIDITERKLIATQIHELGRSLGSITSAVQALRRGAWQDSDFRAELLAGVEEEAIRLTQLLEDLMIIDERVSGMLQIRPQQISLQKWLGSILAPWKGMAETSGLTWICELPEDLPALHADPQRLDQIIGNLLSNAIKYTPAGGNVSVKCGREDHEIWIKIKDSGRGIPEDQQAHIFMPFYRSASSDYGSRGMGLGLTIVRDLVKAHGGRVELESTPDSGSTFTVWLPLDHGSPDSEGGKASD